MDSDEDETFVTIGTPLEIFDEDEIPKKPSSALDLPVKDKKGRERFHGAFTGGFSAGYFNTVGSKDGFTPASFVSSRDKKVEGKSQRPEDFMDEEDFDEHGIAPRKLQTSVTYSSEERRKRRYDEAKAMTSGTLFSGAPAIADLILPQKMTIGIKLLRTLGWKEGQGIGPRATHKQKQKAAEKQAEKARVYGCPLPPSQGSDQELDSDSEVINVTFAPKDTTPIVFSAKTNVHGIGYRGLNPQSALPSTHIKLFEPPPITKSGRKGIRGQAFGVGALEDDDDDIYSVDHLSNYDITMTMEDERGDTLGWTAPGRCYKSNQVPPIGYVGKVLEGFTLSDKPLKPKKLFPPPPLPQGYNVRQRHQFRKKFSKPDVEEQKKQTPESHDAVSRGLTLGEVPIFRSVFDLVSKEDRRKMESAKNKSESPTQTLVPSTTQVTPSALTGSINDENTREDVTQETSGTSMVAVGVRDTPTISAESNRHGYGMLFKPFARDSKKQERYEKYLAYFKKGRKDAYQLVVESHMTEWEREHEEAEFTQASNLYKPMSGMMASRFTRAKYRDDDITSDIQRSQEDKSTKTDQAKAAEMKMYGALTRETFEWHPDPVVCKRFNVANPYPGFSIVGLLGSKRDKMSIFNFLDFSGPAEFVCEEPMAIEAPPVPDKEKTSTEENQTVSFKVQSQNKKMPLGKSIFSNFLEGESNKTTTSTVPQTLDVVEGESVATPSQKTEQSKDQDKSSTVDGEERPPMDLFEAIFGDTDSEEDEENDYNEDEKKDDSKDLHVELDAGPSTSYTSVTGSSTVKVETLKHTTPTPNRPTVKVDTLKHTTPTPNGLTVKVDTLRHTTPTPSIPTVKVDTLKHTISTPNGLTVKVDTLRHTTPTPSIPTVKVDTLKHTTSTPNGLTVKVDTLRHTTPTPSIPTVKVDTLKHTTPTPNGPTGPTVKVDTFKHTTPTPNRPTVKVDTLKHTTPTSNGPTVKVDTLKHTTPTPNGPTVKVDTLKHTTPTPNGPTVKVDTLKHTTPTPNGPTVKVDTLKHTTPTPNRPTVKVDTLKHTTPTPNGPTVKVDTLKHTSLTPNGPTVKVDTLKHTTPSINGPSVKVDTLKHTTPTPNRPTVKVDTLKDTTPTPNGPTVKVDTLKHTTSTPNGPTVKVDTLKHTTPTPNGSTVKVDTMKHTTPTPNGPTVKEDTLKHTTPTPNGPTVKVDTFKHTTPTPNGATVKVDTLKHTTPTPNQTHQLPGAPVAIETIEERLSPVAMATDDGEYGPALPPPRLHGTNLSSSKCQPVHSDLEESYTSEHHRHKHKEGKHSSKHRDRHKYKESENTENYSKHRDRHKESENAENRSKHRDRHNESENTENRSKHRDRHKEIESTENSSKHREKHKHKKEKKSKKSKHKKSDKKKSRKKKKDRDLDYEASDSSDSDSDGDLPSNRDIINRLKSLSSDGNFSLKNLV
ncbi:hypothetical protein FSP39_010983 [Pinctada imbricata]|uniref:G-patch domain-containing protein n=1 Tax=Pinctada imbricata TaxID=66713 RepID=A0AA89BX76_PINIB|nr:hypothetical protein FSP39_010983 [Pinctada imbricata]